MSLRSAGLRFPNPDYHPDNYEEVYAQHLEYNLNPAFVVAMYGLMSVAIRPTGSFAKDNELGIDVRRDAGQWLAEKRPMMFLAGHQDYLDHFVDGAAVGRTPQ